MIAYVHGAVNVIADALARHNSVAFENVCGSEITKYSDSFVPLLKLINLITQLIKTLNNNSTRQCLT